MSRDLSLVALARDRKGIGRFLRVPHRLYRNDPRWIAPLSSDLRQVLGPDNPFWRHARAALWVATRDGRDVGRIAGIVDDHHNARHGERTAFFGFFESIDDPAVGAALFTAIRDWARDLGMTRYLGPMNPSINEGCGLLVEGFGSPPVLMMTYNPAYYADLLTKAGLTRCKELLAYDAPIDDRQLDRLERLAARALRGTGGITVRPVDKRALARDLGIIQEVYNEAWEDNWGHVPMTAEEVQFMARRLVPLLDERFALVAEAGDEPAAFILVLPDFNEALARLRGRLLSPRIALVLPYLLGLRRPRGARVLAMGIKRRYRQRGIDAALLAPCLRAMLAAGYQRCELSWVLEDNPLMRHLAAVFGGAAKRYALWEGACSGV